MATTTLRFRIQEVVSSPLTYDLYFEEDTAHEEQASLSLPRSWFRNIGVPKKGLVLTMEQSEGHTFFFIRGQMLASAKTKLSFSAEKLAEITTRQKKAWERVQRLKERIARRSKA